MTQAELIQATPKELTHKPICLVAGHLSRYVRSTGKRHMLIRLHDEKVIWVGRV